MNNDTMKKFELAMKHLLKAQEKIIDDAIQHHALSKSFTMYASIEALIAQTIEDACFALTNPELEDVQEV
tara:strand:- start:1615 stop:1824 length:210 start_codon:yes stop_codon:yes gene_type:complete